MKFYKTSIFLIGLLTIVSCNNIEQLYKYKNDLFSKHESSNFLVKHYTEPDYSTRPLIEFLLDNKDSVSIENFNDIKKICDYTKLPFNYQTTNNWNKNPVFKSSTNVVIIVNTKKISNNAR